MFGLANIFSPRLGLHANVIIHVSLSSFIAFGLAKEPVNGRLILTAKAMKNKQVHKRVTKPKGPLRLRLYILGLRKA